MTKTIILILLLLFTGPAWSATLPPPLRNIQPVDILTSDLCFNFEVIEQWMRNVTTIPWQDYFASSTISGWTTITTKQIYYKRIGTVCFVQYYINGTGDTSGVASFTLPFEMSENPTAGFVWSNFAIDNVTATAGLGKLSGSTVSLYRDAAESAWSNSAVKRCWGQFWYEIK